MQQPTLARTLTRTQIHLLSEDQVRWQWQDDDDRFREYSSEHSSLIEDAHERGQPHADLPGTHGWRVDFGTMQQRNTRSTGRMRTVRRTIVLPFSGQSLGLRLSQRPSEGESDSARVLVDGVEEAEEAQRLSQAAGVSLLGMVLLAVGETAVTSIGEVMSSLRAAARPVTLVFGADGTASPAQINCPGDHGLTTGLCTSEGFGTSPNVLGAVSV